MSDLRARFELLCTTELQTVSGSADYLDEVRQIAREIVATRASALPAQACAVHPKLHVVSTCERCGTFICVACDPGYAGSRVGRCAACRERLGQNFISRAAIVLVVALNYVVGAVPLFTGGMLFRSLKDAQQTALGAMLVVLGSLTAASATLLMRRHPAATRSLIVACVTQTGAVIGGAFARSWYPGLTAMAGVLSFPLAFQIVGALYVTTFKEARPRLRAAPPDKVRS